MVKTKLFSPVNPFLLERTQVYTCGREHSRGLSLSICFLYFLSRIVSQKSTFKSERLMFLLCQEVAHCAFADSHNYSSRDCSFRLTTRQREGRKIYTKTKWISGRSVFLILLSFSSSPSIAVTLTIKSQNCCSKRPR